MASQFKLKTTFKFTDEVDKSKDLLNGLLKTNIDTLKPTINKDDLSNPLKGFAKYTAISLVDGLGDLAKTFLIDTPMDMISNLANIGQVMADGIFEVINPFISIGSTAQSLADATKSLATKFKSDGKIDLNSFLNTLDKGIDIYMKGLDKISSQIDLGTKAIETLDYPYSEKGKDDIVKMIISNDAMSNMFDVFFVFENNDDSQGPQTLPVASTLPEVYNKNAITPTILSARINNISIPGIEKGTTSIPFCGTTIEKPDNLMNDPHQSSFEILADDSLYYIRMFNKISGTDFSKLEEWNELASEQFKSLLGEDARIVMGEMSNLYNSKMDKLFDTSRGKLSIYVKRLYHMPVQKLEKTDKSIFTNKGFASNLPRGFKPKKAEEGTFDNMSNFTPSEGVEKNMYSASGYYMPTYFKFTDVKILGTGNAISFKNDASNTQAFTYDFIYRQCLALEGK